MSARATPDCSDRSMRRNVKADSTCVVGPASGTCPSYLHPHMPPAEQPQSPTETACALPVADPCPGGQRGSTR